MWRPVSACGPHCLSGEEVHPAGPVRRARRLCALAEDYGSEVHISQEQLGVYVGAARESINRQLQQWRRDGILEVMKICGVGADQYREVDSPESAVEAIKQALFNGQRRR